MKKKLLLTSAGLTNLKIRDEFLNLVNNEKDLQVAILATKFEGNADNIFSQKFKSQFFELGFANLDILDLENVKENELEKYDVFFVCGGNTFVILNFAKLANLKLAIEKLFDRNGVYIGVSAGSIIVGPNINIANEVEPDPNEIDLKDLKGLEIVNEIICPHYLPEHEKQVLDFEDKYVVKATRLSDEQALSISNQEVKII